MLTSLASHKALLKHYDHMKDTHMRSLFDNEPQRFDDLSLQAPYIFLDYSKNRISKTTLDLLIKLAHEAQLSDQIDSLFSGSPFQQQELNNTEKRPALHTALRRPYTDKNQDLFHQNDNISQAVKQCHEKMADFLDIVHANHYLGATGKPINTLVSIGIGGSFLGPKMVTDALSPYKIANFSCHYVANIDSTDLFETLSKIDPEQTLFLIQSKSFTTLETLENANAVKAYLGERGFSKEDIARHLAAVTSKTQAALDLGIPDERIFPMWDWVGGRYSLWSAIGFPIAFVLGMENFKKLLSGANEMDEHFLNSPFEENAPVIMGLLGVWYQNYFHSACHTILAYEQYLKTFPDHLQQLDMESNGKHVSRDGQALTYSTGSVIWGGIGCNGQHAYHQLLHQGTHLLPADFITCLDTHHPIASHHKHLFSNCLSQAKALMMGKTHAEATQELISQGLSQEEATDLAVHKENKGNQPSNTLVLNKLTPESLGALTALYEHRTFVQSAIWGINPFDQWGVELGKAMSKDIFKAMKDPILLDQLDASTKGLIKLYQDE